MAKGDFIEVVTGLPVKVMADKAGRQVDGKFTTDGKLNWYKVELQSRSGNVIESTQVPVEHIVSIKVHKKDE